jgi:cupin 2 domain-containing protein
MPALNRGRLLEASVAPAAGERVDVLARSGGAVVEQILSGPLADPLDYDQDHDEWVVVLAGAAELEVAGEPVALRPGDWVLLPGGVAHRLVRTDPGTSWLAVHLPPG